MLKRLIDWFKNLFAKKVTTTPIASVTAPTGTSVLGLDTEAGWNAWRNSFVPTTREYVPTWEQKGRIDELIAASQGPGVDRSGFEVTEKKGWIATNNLVNGQLYTFVLGKPGTLRVFGVSGNEILKLNGQPVQKEGSIPNQSGAVTITVVSANPAVPVGVQVV